MSEDLDELYPPDERSVVAVTGSVTSGFKFWGPFNSIKEAVDWAEARQPFMGHVNVSYIESPESHPVKLGECNDEIDLGNSCAAIHSNEAAEAQVQRTSL